MWVPWSEFYVTKTFPFGVINGFVHVQSNIQKTFKRLRWIFLRKTVNGFQPLTTFPESFFLDT